MATSTPRGGGDLFEWRITYDGFAASALQGCLRPRFNSQARHPCKQRLIVNGSEFDRDAAVIIAAVRRYNSFIGDLAPVIFIEEAVDPGDDSNPAAEKFCFES